MRASRAGVVMASTIPWHMTARAAAELRRIGLDAGRMSLDAGDPVGTIVEKLNGYQPTVMMVYPSIMQILAAEQIAGRLKIAPRHIQCTSEVLTADARDAIEQAFGVVPFNLYAASECGCLAASCGRTMACTSARICSSSKAWTSTPPCTGWANGRESVGHRVVEPNASADPLRTL